MQQDDKIFLYEQFQQYAVQEAMTNSMEQFQQLVTKYGCAIKEVRTKFEVLNEELSIKSKRNPIHAIKSRIIASLYLSCSGANLFASLL